MAVYNGERFISEQLESFVQQTRLPDELIVSDNVSTDRTAAIVRDFTARAPFPVKLFVNDENLGVGRNFDRAMRECTGDLIFLSDSDDVWYPDKLRLMEQALEQSPQAGLAACAARRRRSGSAPVGLHDFIAQAPSASAVFFAATLFPWQLAGVTRKAQKRCPAHTGEPDLPEGTSRRLAGACDTRLGRGRFVHSSTPAGVASTSEAAERRVSEGLHVQSRPEIRTSGGNAGST